MRSTFLFTRALVAFVALPGLMAFVVPLLLARSADGWPSFAWPALLALVPGTALLAWCVREFAVTGKGTLAPWDPPRHLVASGPYALSRNPMYLAVALVLLGWAIGFRSRSILIYALVLLIAFHVRVVFFEERWLARAHREQWTRYAARVPRWLFRTRRAVVVAWVAALVALPLGGLIYEAYADGTAMLEFTPPGRLVDIGGRRLHLLCIGDGEPIVIFEGASFQHALSAARARERVASRTTVCSYDRGGIGWSDPAPAPISVGDQARDLAVLQDRARLRGPFVLVASSAGGLTAELFARRYPERAAGLVFLDAASSFTLEQQEATAGWLTPAACSAGILAHFGVIRLLDPFGLGREAAEGARRSAALSYNSRRWMQLCAMARGVAETVREFQEAPPLRPDLPVIVLSASTHEELAPAFVLRFVDVDRFQASARAGHQSLARVSSRGQWQVVPDSTHLIASSQPDVVADAVLQMLDDVK